MQSTIISVVVSGFSDLLLGTESRQLDVGSTGTGFTGDFRHHAHYLAAWFSNV